MIRKIGKKTSAALIAGILAGMAALMALISCGDDEVLALDPDTYDTVVAFRVNRTGDGFRNIGTGGNAYTATAVGGSFTTSAGRRVFDTGGTEDGTWNIPWSAGNSWKRFIDIGYVNLGEAVGDLLATSAEWTVEAIFAFPGDYPMDIVDQYVWSFNNETPFPASMIGFNPRHMFVRLNKPQGNLNPGHKTNPDSLDAATAQRDGRNGDPNNDFYNAKYYEPSWGGLNDTYRSQFPGYWTHVVVTKSGDTITIYKDGQKTGSDTLDAFPTYEAGTFVENYLGKTPYVDGGESGTGVYGSNLRQTAYYHFAIDDKAWDADEVDTRFNDSPVGKGQLIVW